MATQDATGTIKIPAGRVGVIRSFSYHIALFSEAGTPFTGLEPLTGPYNFAIQVDGVNAEGIPLSAQTSWPQFLYEQTCFVICPEKSVVTFVFAGLDSTLVSGVTMKVSGDLLPTHGFPPAFEIASMGNLGPIS
jgi:hypothetical protein